ncbi:tRNA (N(6)-L-threonylcarbamoyladenosine(37)-C(2))-methylthiotransferase MtaB [Neoasaia chiangmaiensis]|uniref:tRNA (N(6)-L-threonylcarbamoyladenosine(37)-C(2))-methylthiotransferase MtaB n=1 Tax=Neoasaia chiangmaiensis TaxID=320497 RepID=A0A1U9KS14_9PROT|nr:tRNA (N(6)-L-threonylcarbamoyladenosine(37)-C(2))-methylthiotransferase MtaB [Neoasaia chiangmaiensis]AQS88623.1 tRNA (N(6)-L-threonylcarbamoyladenosine(37)-C(2))-methylthiotransferase MtaB [Neoasaia chiangmaiensis]GEN15486.1 tRNA (N(6)-L-threonylcarbamoyladenosine(37)-C(2))-methylthiotransferase MtaB [Neoasaia chiangmaiensis]
MSGADVLTFGCRLNLHESEAIENHARHLKDVVVVNTCAVTGSAERQARQAIRRVHRDRPEARIVVTGCAAQVAPEKWTALPGVARVMGNAEKMAAASWQEAALRAPPMPVADIMTAPMPATPVVESSGHTRALLQVQQGCDHRCTFCIIPFGRGPSRSVPVGEAIARAQALVAAGHREIVLTGVDIASWGTDLAGRPQLGALCRALLRAVPELPRLRLSSVDPAAFDAELWAVLADEPRFAPHLHLSLQAASDLVLKRMKRRHSRAQAGELIERARRLRPDIGIGADLIAGFPTETDEQAMETLDFVREHRIPYLHVFPYSERPGTPAARMPAVPNARRQARAAALRAAGQANRAAFWQGLVGQELDVLMEGAERGHSAQFAAIRLANGQARRGERLTLRAVALDPDALVAEIA